MNSANVKITFISADDIGLDWAVLKISAFLFNTEWNCMRHCLMAVSQHCDVIPPRHWWTSSSLWTRSCSWCKMQPSLCTSRYLQV